MTLLRRILAGGALIVMASGLASADQIATFTSSFPSSTTDVINSTLAINAFDPGVNGIPAGAVIDFWTLSVTQTIAGTIDIKNNTANTFGPGAFFGVDTKGAVSIGSKLTGDGQPDGFVGDATNDLFGGGGPDPTANLSVAGLAVGGDTGAVPYSVSTTVTTSNFFNFSPQAPPDPITLYFSTFTRQSSAGLGGNGSNNYTDAVSLNATITYDYTIPNGTPEPATLALMGGALLGLGFLGKRLRKN